MADTSADISAIASTKFSEVPIEITISVGMARPLIRELLALEEEAVLPLDRALNDPVELFVGDTLIGRGQLEEIDGEGSGKLGVRIVEVVSTPEEE